MHGRHTLALACAKNVYAAVDRRSPEAGALATWLSQSATAFGLPDSALPSDDDEPGRSRRRGVKLEDWRKIRGALDWASDMALVRSLRDRSHVQQVAVRILIFHDDLCLWKEPTHYRTLPNAHRLQRNRVTSLDSLADGRALNA
jgi:hypothetical protein